MRPPIFVRALSAPERETLERGLRVSDAFTLRRSQMLLASARGARVPQIAQQVGVSEKTVRQTLRTFNRDGLAVLQRGSSRPHTTHPAFTPTAAAALPGLLHRSPREFGKPTSVWTLELVAAVSGEQGLTVDRVTGEAIRKTLKRLGLNWKRAKRWITSPDPAYGPKRRGAIA